MLSGRLRRFYTSELGTPGLLAIGDYRCFTLELPWRENRRNVSCVVGGTYVCEGHASPRFGPCFLVRDVPGRSGILVHAGNWAGTAPEYKSDVEGCILVGDGFGMVARQWGIRNSQATLRRLEGYLWPGPFELVIEWL